MSLKTKFVSLLCILVVLTFLAGLYISVNQSIKESENTIFERNTMATLSYKQDLISRIKNIQQQVILQFQRIGTDQSNINKVWNLSSGFIAFNLRNGEKKLWELKRNPAQNFDIPSCENSSWRLVSRYFVLCLINRSYSLSLVFNQNFFLERSTGFFIKNISFFDNNMNLLFANHNSLFLIKQKNGLVVQSQKQHGHLISTTSLDPLPGFIQTHTAASTATGLVIDMYRSIILWFVAILFIALVIGVLFIKRLIFPLEQLGQAVEKFGTGQNFGLTSLKSKDEISKLINSFRQMTINLQKRKEETERAQRDLIQAEKLASLGKFSAGVAHEVKNPLSSILTHAQLSSRILRKEEISNEKLRKYLELIERETQRANRIIQELLTFSREDKMILSQIPVKDLLDELNLIYKDNLNEKKISWEMINADTELVLQINREKMLQALRNLIDNAIYAVTKSDGEKSIQVKLVETDKLHIEIIDTGIGISESDIEHIFDPFYTTKGPQEGTGLGMAIVHGIVKGHSGDITVKSQEGAGTIFTISLPIAEISAAEN